MRSLARHGLALLGAACCGPLAAQQAIYTCVDAAGRRLSSDRPILACIDREQRVLGPNGTLRATLPPSYTADERAALKAKARQAADERQREQEQRQRERALLTRYPDVEALERERAEALARVDDLIATADRRAAELHAQQRKLEGEAAFYAKNPARMPPTLKRAVEENQHQLQAQQRFVADQQAEKQRIGQRFDAMRSELQRLRGQQAAQAGSR